MSTRKIIVSILTLAAIGVFATTLIYAVYFAPSGEIPLSKDSKLASIIKSNPSFAPIRLSIPSIKVDAKIQQVGITKKGNMATPNNFTDVGWYKYGTLPGDKGSAVIAGHVDNGLAMPGVFINLKNLKKGDDIYVTEGDNKSLHFIVTGTKVYDFNASTNETKEVFDDTRGKLLKLITCTGDWIPAYKTHDKRLVVTAELANN